jgi:hypothetical protein
MPGPPSSDTGTVPALVTPTTPNAANVSCYVQERKNKNGEVCGTLPVVV